MKKKILVACMVLATLVVFTGVAQASWQTGTITGVTHVGTYIKVQLTRSSDSAVFDYRIDTSLDAATQREMMALALTAWVNDSTVTAWLETSSSPYVWTSISASD